MSNRTSLAVALATASIVVLSAQAAHAAVPMPPRPTITVPVVKPAIPAVKPHIPVTNPVAPVFHCKCGGHPPVPTINNYPYGHRPQPIWVKPPVKPPVTTTVTSTSSHPGSFAGKPATLNTTNSSFQGPAGSGTQTTTVITDSSGNVVGAISSAALNKPTVATKPAPLPTPPKPGTVPVYKPSSAPVQTPAVSAAQPGTVPVQPATTAPQPAANQPGAPQPGTVPVQTSAPAANAPAPSHPAAPAASAAPASAPAHAAQPAASAPPKKPDVWKPVLYPAFTDQYKSPKGYYADGKLVMGFKGPSGSMCSPTVGFSTIGSGTVSSTSGPGTIQVPAVLCYVKS